MKGREFCLRLFKDDHYLLQQSVRAMISQQRRQRIVYTEILVRPDLFSSTVKDPDVHLKDVVVKDHRGTRLPLLQM